MMCHPSLIAAAVAATAVVQVSAPTRAVTTSSGELVQCTRNAVASRQQHAPGLVGATQGLLLQQLATYNAVIGQPLSQSVCELTHNSMMAPAWSALHRQSCGSQKCQACSSLCHDSQSLRHTIHALYALAALLGRNVAMFMRTCHSCCSL